MPLPRHVLILETKLEGHHPKWVALFCEAFQSLGSKVSVAAPQPEEIRRRASKNYLGVEPDFLKIDASDGIGSLAPAAALMQKIGADEFFATSLDNFSSALLRRAAFGVMPPAPLRGKLSGVYVRPRPIDPAEHGFKKMFKAFGFNRLYAGGWWGRIMLYDPDLLAHARVAYPKMKFGFVPDTNELLPLPARDEARRSLGIPEGKIVLLHYGVDSRRKGLDLLLDALEQCKYGERLHLLRAGPANPKNPALARVHALQNAGRATSLDHLILTDEEARILSACDVVLLPYLSHYGSSNLLTGSATARRPVLASDYHLLGRLTQKRNLGWTFRDQDAADLACRLDEIALAPVEKFASFDASMATFGAENTREAFVSSLRGLYTL